MTFQLSKKGFEFSFGFLFAIVIGGIIIFLAIYFASTLLTYQKKQTSSFATASFDTLLYPLGTGLDRDKMTPFEFAVDNQLTFDCQISAGFGQQVISADPASTIGTKYAGNGLASRSADKYVFAASPLVGKKFFAFTKPLNMPYKVADLIFLIPNDKEYCLVSPPSGVSEEINNFKEQNPLFNASKGIEIETSPVYCQKGTKKVCFYDHTGCDKIIDPVTGVINADGKTSYFDPDDSTHALLYAAIFSDLPYYSCELNRLVKRSSQLALLYAAKENTVSDVGCGIELSTDLLAYANLTKMYTGTPESLGQIFTMSSDIGRSNANLIRCPLF